MFVEEKTQGEVAPAKVGALKLSEAIRIGAKFRPQCTGDMFVGGGSCALGAAFEALTGRTDYYSSDVLPITRYWPSLGREGGFPGELMNEITDRNDSGEYTREQIADWLEAQGY